MENKASDERKYGWGGRRPNQTGRPAEVPGETLFTKGFSINKRVLGSLDARRELEGQGCSRSRALRRIIEDWQAAHDAGQDITAEG